MISIASQIAASRPMPMLDNARGLSATSNSIDRA